MEENKDRDDKGRFIEGHRGFRNGAENKLTFYAKQRILSALKRLDPERMAQVIEKARPGEILSFLAKLSPKDLNVNIQGEVEMKHAQFIIDGKEVEPDIDDKSTG